MLLRGAKMAAEYGRGRKGIGTFECRKFYETGLFERRNIQKEVKK